MLGIGSAKPDQILRYFNGSSPKELLKLLVLQLLVLKLAVLMQLEPVARPKMWMLFLGLLLLLLPGLSMSPFQEPLSQRTPMLKSIAGTEAIEELH